MATFRQLPIAVEAVRWDGDPATALAFVGERCTTWDHALSGGPCAILLPTPRGVLRGEVGDWIVRGLDGVCRPVELDVFASTHEPAGDQP